jgi:autotransporter-associated beta strand protein
LAFNVFDVGMGGDATLVINGAFYINSVIAGAPAIYTYNGDANITVGTTGTIDYMQGDFTSPTNTIIKYAATGSNLVFSGTGSSTTVQGLWPAAANYPYNVTINTIGTITTDDAKTINGTLTLQAGTLARTAGNLTMGAGSNIYRSGGTISYASANITFTNYNLYYNNFAASITTGTECTTSATALKNLTIESLGGYGVTLGAATTINTSGSLTLTSGVLTTTSYLLTVSNTAAGAITGGSTTSFIDGPVKWNIGTGSYVFPVGNGSGNYLPFTLVTSASASPVITVQAFNSDAGAAATFGASLSGISHTEFWSATLNLGTFTGKVSLTRQTALQANLSLIGQSAAQAGSYASIGGTASSPSINTSNAITSVLGYFVMGFSPTTNYYWNGSNVTAFNHPWDNAGTYWTSPTAIAGLNAIWPAVTGSYTANFTSATAATTVTLPGTIAYNPVNTIIGTNNYTFTSSSPASLNSPIALGGNTLTLAPASAVNSITLPGIISGTGGITNTTGTSILSGANTYSGTTTLSSGTLDINNAAAIGTGTFTITGGTIDNTSGGTITLSNNNVQNWNGDFTFTGTNALNVGTGAVAMNASRQVTVSSSTLAVGGIISGAFRLTKAGSGALTLSGANNYTGGMTLSAGTLNINNASALGTIAGTFIINGGTIDNTTAGSITTVNYPQTWGGDFTFAGSQNLNLGTGAVSMSASRTVTISSNTLTIGGVISGATFGLTKTGAGTLTLTNTGNTYSGTTIITGGTLTLNPNAVAATFASQVELNGGTLSTTSIATNTVITSSSTLNLNASSTIALGTNVHSLKFADSHSISWTGSTTLTITGWTGTVSTGPGTGGRIFFGGATGTLTAGQLAQISFTGYTGAMLTASGELVPVSAPCTAPSTQASGFSTPIITSNSIDYAFTRGNGNDVLVICKAGSAPTAPTCGTIYSASATYGSGTAVGGGYCVYNGTAAGASNPTGNITITGLTGGTTYYFGVYEYNTTGTCYDLTALTGGPITTTTCQTMNGYPHPQMTGFVINSCKTGTGCAADESLEEGSNEMCIFNSGPTPIPVTNSATAAANIALYYGSTIGSGDWENYSSSYVSDPVGYCALLNTTAGCGKTLFIDALTAGTIPANSIFLITSQSPNYPYNFSNLCGICPYIYVLFSTSPYWTCCAHEEGGRTGNFANTASGIRYFGTSITDNTSVNTTWYYQYNPGSSGQAWSPEDTPGDEISYAIATSSNATSGNPLAPTQYFTNACTSVGSSILPIELIYFNATCSDNKVDLPWSTASETNNDYFTIERSKDGEIWETVTVVKGAGNSNSTIDYNAQDNSPSSNVSYYRLKQTDFNGKTVSFNPVAVSCNSNSTDYFVLKPNPAIDEVTCSVVSSEDNNAIIEIINYLGQKMFFNNYNLTKGFNDIKFDISKYSNGIYTVIVYSSDGKIINSKQLVIQRR